MNPPATVTRSGGRLTLRRSARMNSLDYPLVPFLSRTNPRYVLILSEPVLDRLSESLREDLARLYHATSCDDGALSWEILERFLGLADGLPCDSVAAVLDVTGAYF